MGNRQDSIGELASEFGRGTRASSRESANHNGHKTLKSLLRLLQM